jgi:hypothetical protein
MNKLNRAVQGLAEISLRVHDLPEMRRSPKEGKDLHNPIFFLIRPIRFSAALNSTILVIK